MEQINKTVLQKLNSEVIQLPSAASFNFPEKVLQFGTGVLLRGLPDYFINKANQQNVFNGRVVVVKSTAGSSEDFEQQDNIYTIIVRGIEDGNEVHQTIINNCISRVINANEQWDDILNVAVQPELVVIISNTTEVGIQMSEDKITDQPPHSFPGKLLAVLYQRYKAFKGAADKGLVILPTELISNNGQLLESIVIELAHNNNLEYEFIEWLENHNHFCNTLVDRIVPGKPANEVAQKIYNELGYQDELLIMAEVFRLWAIEGNEEVKSKLTFAQVDAGVKIVPDITVFKELKLRLLNATHTFTCALAWMAGFEIVREAMSNIEFRNYITTLMLQEIVPSIPGDIDDAVKLDFANSVADRFSNPSIDHQWISITLQYSSKMRMRCLPLIENYFNRFAKLPPLMMVGFATYLRFMKPVRALAGKYFGEYNGREYTINDDDAAWFYDLWSAYDAPVAIEKILSNEKFWGVNLSGIKGFSESVLAGYQRLEAEGAAELIVAAYKPLQKI